MSVDKKKLLKKRKEISARRPKFVRQESWRYKRVDTTWRKPRGIDNKMKEKRKGYPSMVNVGYRSPKKVRGLHPSGYEVVHIGNPAELEFVDREIEAIMIKRTVGARKRQMILDTASDLNLKILNPPATIEEISEVIEEAELDEVQKDLFDSLSQQRSCVRIYDDQEIDPSTEAVYLLLEQKKGWKVKFKPLQEGSQVMRKYFCPPGREPLQW